ncbi:MAG: MFS transporter [Acidobacteria bacterium]|nr:MFS transporter [Acidobacteriota bacterium]
MCSNFVSAVVAQSAAPAAQPASDKRWWALALLFLSIAVNLLDRQVLSLMAPLIRDELALSNTQYSYILFFFLFGMTLFQLPAGRFLDRYGVRVGLAAIMVWWSAANGLHALARNVWHFCGFRFLLGAGECGNYSGGIKAISQWFPPRERALAGGIFNSGTVIGAALAPLLIVPIGMNLGWRWTFVVPSALGLLWLIPWLLLYRDRPSAPEAGAGISGAASGLTLARLFSVRQVWGAVLVRAMGGPVSHFYWYWLPEYLKRERAFSMEEIGMTAWAPYLSAGLGNVLGGGLSGALMRRGMEADRARKTAFVLATALASASMLVPWAADSMTALVEISIATAGVAAMAATHIGMLTDLFSEKTLARLTGVTGMGEGLVNMVLMVATGMVVDAFSYTPVFLAAGLMPFLALTSVFVLVRKIERVEL